MFFLSRLCGKPSDKKPEQHRTILHVESLEDRFTPTTFTWTGLAGGLWSIPADWDQMNGVPGPGDTALFDNTHNNRNSVMDLPGVNTGNMLGTLKIDGYTGVISLQKQLTVDVLNMNSGTIDGSGYNALDGNYLVVNQDVATTFAASSWSAGNLGGGKTSLSF